MPRVRTFIAVEPGKAIRDRLLALQETFLRTGAEVKWVEPENLHVTLLFLGEVDTRDVNDVCKLVQRETGKFDPFVMSVEGVGCFGNARRPRTIWAGVGAGSATLIALHDALEAPLEELGYRREERRYTPHITLGRVKGDRAVDELADTLFKKSAWKGGEIEISQLHVMSSELRPQGPVYTVLSRAAFK